MSLESLSYDELVAKARALHEAAATLKAERSAVAKEISFRDQAGRKLKALAELEGMTPAEVARLKALAQSVAPQGVASAEKVGSPDAASGA